MIIRTKSVYSPIDRQRDGLRILATRFRGRGLRKTRYHVWMPSLAPSERLLQAARNQRITWREFCRRYQAELFARGRPEPQNRHVKNHGQKFTLQLLRALARRQPVTLLCHCGEQVANCHRHLLRRLLDPKARIPTSREPAPAVLHLNLRRDPFVAILTGRKHIEYRQRTRFWRTRLENRCYDQVRFRNGCSAKAPLMVVEFKGLRVQGRGRHQVYAIRLGRILKTQWCARLKL